MSETLGEINVKIKADASQIRKDFDDIKTQSAKDAQEIEKNFNDTKIHINWPEGYKKQVDDLKTSVVDSAKSIKADVEKNLDINAKKLIDVSNIQKDITNLKVSINKDTKDISNAFQNVTSNGVEKFGPDYQ